VGDPHYGDEAGPSHGVSEKREFEERTHRFTFLKIEYVGWLCLVSSKLVQLLRNALKQSTCRAASF
jgi:hypothetical protein